MTFGEWHRSVINQLGKIYSSGEAKAIARRVFEDALHITSVDFFLKSKSIADSATQIKLEEIIIKLLRHEPIQYITGIADFYGLKLKVNPAVLIPRPETEELVKWIIIDLKESVKIKTSSILDIGTGSGCIAIALKKYISDATISAMDISTVALSLAKENAAINKADVNFIERDILSDNPSDASKYDIIVSNPPYITQTEKSKMSPNVLNYEPHSALFVQDNNALQFYKAISQYALNHLNTNGNLYFEINESLGKEVTQLLADYSFQNIILRKDINGKDRMIRCTKPS